MSGVKKGSSAYSFVCISYCPVDFILSVLEKHINQIRAYSVTTHDRFTDWELENAEDGHKEVHTHILITTFNSCNFSQVRNWFKYYDVQGQKVNTLVSRAGDTFKAFRYQLHLDDPEKFQFLPEERITYNPELFEDDTSLPQDNALSAFEDMLAGVPLADIARRYGRDFIYHYHHLKLLYNDIKNS